MIVPDSDQIRSALQSAQTFAVFIEVMILFRIVEAQKIFAAARAKGRRTGDRSVRGARKQEARSFCRGRSWHLRGLDQDVASASSNRWLGASSF
jgi:hypothetical protein